EVFDVITVRAALLSKRSPDSPPKSAARISFASGGSEALGAIQDARWIDDRHIAFLATNRKAPQQIYELDVPTRSLRRLSSNEVADGNTGNVKSLSRFRGGLVYTAISHRENAPSAFHYPATVVAGDEFRQVEPDARSIWTDTVFEERQGSPPRPILSFSRRMDTAGLSGKGLLAPVVSPDGAVAIAAFNNPEHPRAHRQAF